MHIFRRIIVSSALVFVCLTRGECKNSPECVSKTEALLSRFSVIDDAGNILDSGSIKIYVRSTPHQPTVCDYLIRRSRTDLCSYICGDYTDYQNGTMRRLNLPEHQAALAPDSTGVSGVQYRNRYAGYIPQVLERKLGVSSPDTNCDTTVNLTERINGEPVAEYSLTYKGNTVPERVIIRSRVGNERSVVTDLTYTVLPAQETTTLTDSTLKELLPFLSGDSRDFIGWPMPGFSVPTPDHGRFEFRASERPDGNIMIVFISPDTQTDKIMAEARTTATEHNVSQLIWAVDDNRPESAGKMTPGLQKGEQVVMRGQSIFKLIGVTKAPAMILLDEEGIIRDIQQL